VKFTTAAGDTAELELPEGSTRWREAEEHATENVGATVIRGLFVEPK
jgi:hypothetical protein